MRTLYDYGGLPIRLTDERLAHTLDHPEMFGMEAAIAETLQEPESIIRSPAAIRQGSTTVSILIPQWAGSFVCDSKGPVE